MIIDKPGTSSQANEKRQMFREEIRRKQIDKMFAKKRKVLHELSQVKEL